LEHWRRLAARRRALRQAMRRTPNDPGQPRQ
jgi:hypothetical protein